MAIGLSLKDVCNIGPGQCDNCRITVGGHAGPRAEFDQEALEANGQSVQPTLVFNDAQEDDAQQGWDKLKSWFEDGSIRPVIDRVLPWSQASTAQHLLLDREVFGKVVLAVE